VERHNYKGNPTIILSVSGWKSEARSGVASPVSLRILSLCFAGRDKLRQDASDFGLQTSFAQIVFQAYKSSTKFAVESKL